MALEKTSQLGPGRPCGGAWGGGSRVGGSGSPRHWVLCWPLCPLVHVALEWGPATGCPLPLHTHVQTFSGMHAHVHTRTHTHTYP